jgi:hypothetical protein
VDGLHPAGSRRRDGRHGQRSIGQHFRRELQLRSGQSRGQRRILDEQRLFAERRLFDHGRLLGQRLFGHGRLLGRRLFGHGRLLGRRLFGHGRLLGRRLFGHGRCRRIGGGYSFGNGGLVGARDSRPDYSGRDGPRGCRE